MPFKSEALSFIFLYFMQWIKKRIIRKCGQCASQINVDFTEFVREDGLLTTHTLGQIKMIDS